MKDLPAPDPVDTARSPFSDRALDYSPWTFWSSAGDDRKSSQRDLQRQLIESGAADSLGENCFVSDLASVHNEELRLGDRTYIAAGAYLTGSLRAGRDCTINPYAVIRGAITLGDAVRIGAHTSLLGFNHTMTDPDTEVFRQPITTKGIAIGNDVWIGSHAVVLDGISIGDPAMFTDRPGTPATVRAQCDAIEIADLLLGRPPAQLSADEQVQRLRGWQDPRTGLVTRCAPTESPPEPSVDSSTPTPHTTCSASGTPRTCWAARFPNPSGSSPMPPPPSSTRSWTASPGPAEPGPPATSSTPSARPCCGTSGTGNRASRGRWRRCSAGC